MKILLMLILLTSCQQYPLPTYTDEEEKIMNERWAEFNQDAQEKQKIMLRAINSNLELR